MEMNVLLDRWDIRRGTEAEWAPWGGAGNARAKVLGEADGYNVTLVEAEAGYTGGPHEHTHAEFFYLIQGRIRNQGKVISGGDGYAAAAGSADSDFEALSASTYLIIWRL